MANIKPSHMKKDSNPYRQKQNEQEKQEMKEQFKSVDLTPPSHFHLRNEKMYWSLVNNLEVLGLSVHLKGIDTFSLVSIANTFDILSEIEQQLQQHGLVQIGRANDNTVKMVASPLVSMRNSTLNLLQSQLKGLQLDPQSRQLLITSVQNDAAMFVWDDEEDDDDISAILAKAIGGN